LIDGASWKTLHADFQVEAPSGEVEFILEYRAAAGEAWFDTASMIVKKTEASPH
jgi:hypothetical protein